MRGSYKQFKQPRFNDNKKKVYLCVEEIPQEIGKIRVVYRERVGVVASSSYILEKF